MAIAAKYSVGLGPLSACGDRFIARYKSDDTSVRDRIKMLTQVERLEGVYLGYPSDFSFFSTTGELKQELDKNSLKTSMVEIELFSESIWKYGSFP